MTPSISYFFTPCSTDVLPEQSQPDFGRTHPESLGRITPDASRPCLEPAPFRSILPEIGSRPVIVARDITICEF